MAEKPDTTNPSAQSASAAGGATHARPPDTYARRFLRLMALHQAIEKTLHEMAALLDTPEGVPIPARAPVRGNQRRGA